MARRRIKQANKYSCRSQLFLQLVVAAVVVVVTGGGMASSAMARAEPPTACKEDAKSRQLLMDNNVFFRHHYYNNAPAEFRRQGKGGGRKKSTSRTIAPSSLSPLSISSSSKDDDDPYHLTSSYSPSPSPSPSPSLLSSPSPEQEVFPSVPPTVVAPLTPTTTTPSPSSSINTFSPTTSSMFTNSPTSSMAPSPIPTISSRPSISNVPTISPPELVTGMDDEVYYSQCGELRHIPEDAGPLQESVFAFDYKLTVSSTTDSVVDEQKSIMEQQIQNYLTDMYMKKHDCIFGSDTRQLFDVYYLTSSPIDTLGTVCETSNPQANSCRIIHAAISTKIFYWNPPIRRHKRKNRRRNLEKRQHPKLTDPTLAQSFGTTIRDAMNTDVFLTENIIDTEFIAITNFENNQQETFDGIDPETDKAAGAERGEDLARFGNHTVSWGAAILGLAAIALIITGSILIFYRRRRRRGAGRNSQENSDNDVQFTYDDDENDDGLRSSQLEESEDRKEEIMNDDDDDSSFPESRPMGHVFMPNDEDHMADTGEAAVSRLHHEVEVENTFDGPVFEVRY